MIKKNMEKKSLSKGFLIVLVLAALAACYFIFRPFLSEILIAAILATIFYRPYSWLAVKLGGRRNTAALLMSLFVVLVVIVPLANLIILSARESVTVYAQASEFLSKTDWNSVIRNSPLAQIKGLDLSNGSIQGFIMDVIQKSSNWLVSGAAGFIKGTTGFIFSILFIIMTMFFFFLDGKKMLEKLMILTPLPNKYDKEIFTKFQDVSKSFFVSTFVVAIAQGFGCWLGFYIITLPFFFGIPMPAFFAGSAAAFGAFIPFVGAWPVWLAGAIYLFFTGHAGAALFLVIWGIVAVHPIDNVLRPIMLHKKANVHPIFLLFSILGGISLFGFWGVVIGPLVVAVAITIFHIYEMEYGNVLEK